MIRAAKKGVSLAKKKARTAVGLVTKLRYCYGWHYKYSSVEENTILFESFHGKTLSDSPLYMLREFVASERSRGFKIYYSTTRDNLARHAALAKSLGLDVELVPIESRKYARLLATAQYLVNNSSFPAYFTRRPEQRYIQTWHGTPLKTLGKRMRLGIESMYNVQHNFLQANVITCPNEFTREVLMRDYNLENLYTGKVALLGYPRNQVFFDAEKAEEIRSYYGLDGFETFAYMPTWRGANNYSLDIEGYREQVMGFLSALDERMRDDQLLFVNFHSMVAAQMGDFEFDHIFPFPASKDNYEFLNVMDVLITDYSSVFFDYSITRKPIILFAYDQDEYLAERGMYLGLEDLPFQVVGTIDELACSIREGTFRNYDYSGSQYEQEFLANDSPDNAKNALDLLFEGASDGVEIVDYRRNADKEWNIVEPCRQATVEDVATACQSAVPEEEIMVFLRSKFDESKSQVLHDWQGEPFNYVFITKAYNCTGLEQFLLTRSNRVRKSVAEREKQRVFPGLNVPAEPQTRLFTADVGTSYVCKDADLLQASAVVDYDKKAGMVVRFELDGYEVRHLLLVRKRAVIASKPLTTEEIRYGAACKTLAGLLDETELHPGDSIRVFLSATPALGEDVADEATPVSFHDGLVPAELALRHSDEPAPESARAAYPPVVKSIEDSDDRLSIMPYQDKNGKLHLYCSPPGKGYARFVTAELEHARREEGLVVLRLKLPEGDFIFEDLVLRFRSKTEEVEHHLPYDLLADDGWLVVESRFDPEQFEFREVYWDLFVIVRRYGLSESLPVSMSRTQLRLLKIKNQQWRIGQDKVLFSHIAGSSNVSFVYRDYYPSHDTYALRVKEFAALGTYRLLRPYWKHRRIWLVYEKFCSLAQDNAFYFFDYCMSLPKEQRGHVYYVIDKSKPDYANVAAHDAQVLDFLSFKHILYALAADLYIASDSKAHLYAWRNKPSFVRSAISKRKIFFLQHGVTALKRVDHLFGKKGSSPMTYFLTTSEREQDIVVGNFGYSRRQAPVLGFSRWDVLEDSSSACEPSILLMPTWRPWLEEQSDEVFVASEYYERYSSLIRSEELARLLESHNATLKFFIHPKLSAQLKNFARPSERIQLIEQGSEPLNEVMMKCNMLVTDYSSVCWDMLYMDKPVVFYQFDQELYEEVVGSYVDLNSDLPGYVCRTEHEVVEAIGVCAEGGFSIDPSHKEVADGWFSSKDDKNRERTFDFIVNEGY